LGREIGQRLHKNSNLKFKIQNFEKLKRNLDKIDLVTKNLPWTSAIPSGATL
jgi:hypothetical protein